MTLKPICLCGTKLIPGLTSNFGRWFTCPKCKEKIWIEEKGRDLVNG